MTPITTATNQPGPPISLSGPVELAITPDGSTAYVLTAGSTLTPIDLATMTPRAAIALAHPGQAIEITPDGALALVAETGFVQVVDLASGTPEAPVAVTDQSLGDIAIAPDGVMAYVESQSDWTDGPVGWPTKYAHIYPFTIASRTAGAALSATEFPLGISKLAVNGDSARLFGVVPCAGSMCPFGFVIDRSTTVPERGGTLYDGTAGPTINSPVTMVLAPSPAASFTATPGHTNGVTSFDAVASNNDGGSITGYRWEFGDGSTMTTNAASATHVYYVPGTYTVKLTTTNAGGCASRFVYTGQSAACNGSPTATTTRQVTIIRPGAIPTTVRADLITRTGATLFGTTGETTGQTDWHFEYGTTTRYGKATPPRRGSGTVQAAITGLKPNTVYHYRLVVATEQGTPPVSSGADRTFRTAATGTLRLQAKTLRLRGKSVNVALRCVSDVGCRGGLKLTAGKRTCATATVRLKAHQRAQKRMTVRSTCRSKRSAKLTSTVTTGQKDLAVTVRIKR